MGKRNNKKERIVNKAVDIIRKITISKRLLISFILISTLPVALIFLLVNNTSLKLIKNNIISNDKVASQLITTSITDYITKFDYITNEIIWNDNLLKGMSQYTKLNSKDKERFKESLSQLLRSRTTYVSDIADFTILDSDLNVIHNEGFSYIGYENKVNEIKKSIENNSPINWSGITIGNSKYITTTKCIKANNEVYGYVFLGIKEKVILEMFRNYNTNFDGGGLIIDNNGSVIASNYKKEESDILTKEQIADIKQVEEIDNLTKIISINNKEYIVMTRGISYAPWKLVGIVPYDYIYSTFIDVYKVLGVLCIVLIVLSILIAIIIHKSIANPIHDLIDKMNDVDEGTLGNEMIISGNDEISYIMKKYNKMSKNLGTLIYDIKLREKEKKEVTLRLLQAQINPHFLFNTLGSLRYLAIMNNDNIVSNGLESLAKLLRSIILNKDDFITIEEEVENIKNYITIQKIRYGDNFDISYSVEEELLKEEILKFILQPIVENCILHGFDESSSHNFININIYSDEETIYFEVSDNGVGINEERLEEGSFNIDKFAGIGVKNVKERLSLFYNEEFVFEIRSDKQRGTTTKIIIPKIGGVQHVQSAYSGR